MLASRAGRPRRRQVQQVRRIYPACWLCGHRIDLRLDFQRHPLGSTVDEVVPISEGGSSTDLANLRHAHRCCNSTRGRRPVTPRVRRQCLESYLRNARLPAPVHRRPSRVW